MPVKRNKNGYLTNKFWCKICKKHLSYSFIGYPIFGFDKICKKCLNIKEKIKMSKIICDKCKNLISNELDCYNILGLWLHKKCYKQIESYFNKSDSEFNKKYYKSWYSLVDSLESIDKTIDNNNYINELKGIIERKDEKILELNTEIERNRKHEDVMRKNQFDLCFKLNIMSVELQIYKKKFGILEGDLDLKEKFETIEKEIKNNEKS